MRKTTRDVVADVRELRMEEDASIAVPSVGTYPATHHAHTQIAEKAGIPGRFYDRLRQDFPALLAANVNGLLPAGADRRLIRVADGKVRALLSDRYRSLDSYDLALRVADRAIANNAQVLDASLTETRMSIRVTLPQYREKVGEMTAAIRAAYSGRAHGADMAGAGELDADYVVPGLVVSNSDVGAGAFRVEPYVYRLVCMNGAIGEYSLKQIHVGERLELGEIVYSDRTRAIQDEALWARVGDVIDSTFNPDTFRAMLDQMRAAKSEQLPGVEAVVDVVARDLGLSADRRAMLLSYFAIEGPTVYGLVQGVTAIAQHEAGADA
ncbi:MAG: hypothetical protein ACREC5_03655, partial [Thermoplasmata archaeon]